MDTIDAQRAILAAYAAGDAIPRITTDLGLPRTLVVDTIDQCCGYNRAYAARAVEDLEAGRAPAPREPQPDPEPAADPEPGSEPDDQADLPGDHVDEAPRCEPIHDDPPPPAPRSFTELLAAADACGNPVAADLAARIRQSVDELANLLDAARAEAAARAKVDGLRDQLAAAERELATLTRITGGTILRPEAVDRKAVRAWATDHNMTCPAKGPIPKHVLSAYQADQLCTSTIEKGQS